jgi:hypothetical protein
MAVFADKEKLAPVKLWFRITPLLVVPVGYMPVAPVRGCVVLDCIRAEGEETRIPLLKSGCALRTLPGVPVRLLP